MNLGDALMKVAKELEDGTFGKNLMTNLKKKLNAWVLPPTEQDFLKEVEFHQSENSEKSETKNTEQPEATTRYEVRFVSNRKK